MLTKLNENINTQLNGCFAEVSFAERGLLKNVALVGLVSQNNRRYAVEALRNGYEKYEGAKVFLDHPSEANQRSGGRSVRDLAGSIENARFDGQKIRGDIQLLSNDAGRLVYDIATSQPHIAGMSHNILGSYHRDAETGEQVIDSVEKVTSVDVVTEPATNNGFYESVIEGSNVGLQADEIARLLKSSTLDDGNTVINCESPDESKGTGRTASADEIAKILTE